MRWTVHIEGGPRRVNHAAVPIGKRVYCFGGYCTGDNYRMKTKPIDAFVLNTETYRWYCLKSPISPDDREQQLDVSWPYQRYGHTVSAYGKQILLFGGRNDENPCNVVYSFDTTTHTWSKPRTTGQLPPERDGHSACIIRDALYIFGGYEESNHRFGEDVYKLDLLTMRWELLEIMGEKPIYRDFHTATAIRDNMYIFGGRSDHHWGHLMQNNFATEYYTNKMSYLDTVNLEWRSPDVDEAPQGRRSHSAINLDNKLLMFGGFNGTHQKHMNDLWLFDPILDTWKELTPSGIPPCARRRQAMCLVDTKIFIFGGTSPYHGPPIFYTPEQLALIPDSAESNQHGTRDPLMDHNDLHVLDLSPSLRTLCMKRILTDKLTQDELPKALKEDLENMTVVNTISKPLPLLPLG